MLFFESAPNPYLDDPDVVLMMKFKSGDTAAFDSIMQRNFPRVFAFIVRMRVSEAIAEDLTQEVLIKLYQMAPSYQPRAKLSTLLFQMARNASLNELRQQRPHVSIDGESLELPSPDPRDQLAQQDLASQVRIAIDQLPENQRTAVLLRRYEDMSYEDIAQTMKTTPKAIKSLLNRAKENLKDSLKDLNEIDPI